MLDKGLDLLYFMKVPNAVAVYPKEDSFITYTPVTHLVPSLQVQIQLRGMSSMSG